MWQTKPKRKAKVADASATAIKLDVASTVGRKNSRRQRRAGKRADAQLKTFFDNLGASIESLIDATPLGVKTPIEPWNPDEDRKKALLSNPISVLKVVNETFDAFSHPNTNTFLGSKMESDGNAWMLASTNFLMRLREGLARAVLAEEKMDETMEGRSIDVPAVMVEPEPKDATVTTAAGAFVDLGADRWGNSKRTSHPAREAVTEAKAIKKVCQSKILKIIDNLTLRANGIVVTSDDASVECSISSMVEFEAVPGSVYCSDDDDDDDGFEDCPSVITELAADEEFGEDTEEEEDTEIEVVEEDTALKEETQETKLVSSDDDDIEYVMTEEPDSDEEDFVDLSSEFDVSYRP